MQSALHIGPAGWSYPDWHGIVYPPTKSARFDPLPYLSSYFNLIEVNSTFYRVPRRSTCASWARRVSHRPDFQFTLKAYREFTHTKTPASDHDINAFKRAVEPLLAEERLSAVLIQFPWSFRFSPETAGYVSTLVDRFAPVPAAVEVRHGSWANSNAVAFFEDRDISMCGIDQPQIGNSLPPDVSVAGEAGVYFRLHGRNKDEWFKANTNRDLRYDYLYSREELQPWVERVSRIAEQVNKIHIVLNNHFRGQAVANALQLAAMLGGRRVKAPGGIARVYPRLSPLLERDADAGARAPSGAPSLFEDQDRKQDDEHSGGDEENVVQK